MDAFVGEIKPVGFNFPPRGYYTCNGGLISISQSSVLFAILGTNYGGDGRVSMGLPNLVGKAPIHSGNSAGPGLSIVYVGEVFGQADIALNHTQMPTHSHGPIVMGVAVDSTTPSVSVMPGLMAQNSFYSDENTHLKLMSVSAVSTKGLGVAHENRQPFTAVNYVICEDGEFPSRN